MARRVGIASIQATARELCRLITKFSPLIRQVTGGDASVELALTAALTACSALDEQLAEYREEGV